MTGDQSEAVEFRAERPGTVRLLLPLAPGVFVFFAVAALARRLSPPGPWQGRRFALAVAVVAAAFLLLLLRRRSLQLRGLVYALTPVALEIRSQTETIAVPYSHITHIVESVNPFRVRASMRVSARGRRHLLRAENHTLLVEKLAERTGVAVESPSYPVWLLSGGWPAAALALLGVCLYGALTRLSLLASAGTVVFGVIAAASIVTGRLERHPGRGVTGRRFAYGAVVLLFFAGLGAAGILEWRRSFVRALDLSAWSARLSAPALIEDIPGLSFEVPAGWKVGTSRTGETTWTALRAVGPEGGRIILILAAVPIEPGVEGEFWRFGNAAQANVRAALKQYRRRELDNPGEAESAEIGNATWHAFTEESFLRPGARAVTYWQGSGRTAFSITIEEGDAADPALAGLFASVKVAAPLK